MREDVYIFGKISFKVHLISLYNSRFKIELKYLLVERRFFRTKLNFRVSNHLCRLFRSGKEYGRVFIDARFCTKMM